MPETISKLVLYAVMATWFVFAATFAFRKRPPKAQEVKRRNSMAMLGIAFQAGGFFFLWFRPLQRPANTPLFPMPRQLEIVWGLITVAIAVGSVWLVNSAVRRLGKQWAVAARLVEGHELITDGPYRLIRNPIYGGMGGMLLATGLAVSRWEALLAGIAVFVFGTYIRVRSEEKLLRSAFGKEFEEYARRVPALIPGVY